MLERINTLIKKGEFLHAQKLLTQIEMGKLNRQDQLLAGTLARRTGAFEMGARILYPLVRADGRKVANPTPEERIEYALVLAYLGATKEATRWIEDPKSAQHERTTLYRGYIHCMSWEYEKAVPFLEAFVDKQEVSQYERTVAEVNLAAALVFASEFEKARKLLAELRVKTKNSSNLLLCSNAHEISAQVEFFEGRYKPALQFLKTARKLCPDEKSPYRLFIEKWQAFIELKTNNSLNPTIRLKPVRNLALSIGHIETIRDCDRFEALMMNHGLMMDHIYFGTASEAYRNYLCRDFTPTQRPHYDWKLGVDPACRLKLTLARFESPKLKLKPGHKTHRLLGALSTDFYTSFTLGHLNELVYPGTVYQPISTAQRIHRVIGRTRRLLENAKVPLYIARSENGFRLSEESQCSVQVPQPKLFSMDLASIEVLFQAFGYAEFSSSRAAKILNVSARQVNRILAEQSASIERKGTGKSTVYRITKDFERPQKAA